MYIRSALLKRDGLIGIALLAVIVSYIVPDLVFLNYSPMGGDSRTLKDPTVSWTAFMPAFREFRYEVINHGNFLWSNLRSLGQPMLGNAVQGAPLFPLNLALIWLPDQLYWSVMPLTRLLLIALACFLLAKRVFGFTTLASLAFAITAGLNLNLIRWLNHPWSNGLLAGLWYLYFHCRLLQKNPSIGDDRKLALGVAISAFAMITTGFPEASLMSAMLALVVFVAFLIQQIDELGIAAIRRAMVIITISNLAGLALSAVQIFSLIEYANYSEAWDLRQGYIAQGYELQDMAKFWMSQLTVFWLGDTQFGFLTFSLGLAGTMLALLGFLEWLRVGERKHRWLGLGFVFLMLIFTLKNFKLSSWLEALFLQIPLLAESHFPLYFSPLFFFGFAYFVAFGVFTLESSRPTSIWIFARVTICAALVTTLAIWHAELLSQMRLTEVFAHALSGKGGASILVFAAFVLLLFISLRVLRKSKPNQAIIGTLCILALVLELDAVITKRFFPVDHFLLVENEAVANAIPELEELSELSLHELRGKDRYADYVGLGLATIDNGVSAILPPDLRRVRNYLFNTQFGGYYPLHSAKFDWSYQSLASNIEIFNATPFVSPGAWGEVRHDPTMKTVLVGRGGERYELQRNPLIVSGEVQAVTHRFPHPEIWVRLSNSKKVHWLQANIADVRGIAPDGARELRRISWRFTLAEEWLQDPHYTMQIRVVDTHHQTYSDTPRFELDIAATPHSKRTQKRLLTTGSKDRYLFYFDEAALPRAYLATSCLQFQDKGSVGAFLTSSASVIRGSVGLLDDQIKDQLECSQFTGSPRVQRVEIQEDSGSRLQLAAVQGPALVVLNDAYYPGWEVADMQSKQQLKILSANIAARAVYLPENRQYQLEFSYQPWWLKWVWSLIALGLLLLLILYFQLGARASTTV